MRKLPAQSEGDLATCEEPAHVYGSGVVISTFCSPSTGLNTKEQETILRMTLCIIRIGSTDPYKVCTSFALKVMHRPSLLINNSLVAVEIDYIKPSLSTTQPDADNLKLHRDHWTENL